MSSAAVERVVKYANQYQWFTDGRANPETGEVEIESIRDLGTDAAEAEANYRRVKAEHMAKVAIAQGKSAAVAEISANADPLVAKACLAYKVAAAELSAREKKLTQLRAASEDARAILVYETTSDRMHAAVSA